VRLICRQYWLRIRTDGIGEEDSERHAARDTYSITQELLRKQFE
jgi:hypothetical protein